MPRIGNADGGADVREEQLWCAVHEGDAPYAACCLGDSRTTYRWLNTAADEGLAEASIQNRAAMCLQGPKVAWSAAHAVAKKVAF